MFDIIHVYTFPNEFLTQNGRRKHNNIYQASLYNLFHKYHAFSVLLPLALNFHFLIRMSSSITKEALKIIFFYWMKTLKNISPRQSLTSCYFPIEPNRPTQKRDYSSCSSFLHRFLMLFMTSKPTLGIDHSIIESSPNKKASSTMACTTHGIVFTSSISYNPHTNTRETISILFM